MGVLFGINRIARSLATPARSRGAAYRNGYRGTRHIAAVSPCTPFASSEGGTAPFEPRLPGDPAAN